MQEMEKFGANDIIFSGPISFVVDASAVKLDPETGKPDPKAELDVACVQGEGRKCIALFTDFDLARGFAADIGDNFKPAQYQHVEPFLRCLEKQLVDGQTHVALDPYKRGTRVRTYPILDFIRAVRQTFGLG